MHWVKEYLGRLMKLHPFLWTSYPSQSHRCCITHFSVARHLRHPAPNTWTQPLNSSCTIFALVNINPHCFLQRCVQLLWRLCTLPAAGASFFVSRCHSCSKYIWFFCVCWSAQMCTDLWEGRDRKTRFNVEKSIVHITRRVCRDPLEWCPDAWCVSR